MQTMSKHTYMYVPQANIPQPAHSTPAGDHMGPLDGHWRQYLCRDCYQDVVKWIFKGRVLEE